MIFWFVLLITIILMALGAWRGTRPDPYSGDKALEIGYRMLLGLGGGALLFAFTVQFPLEHAYTDAYERVTIQETNTQLVTTTKIYVSNPVIAPFHAQISEVISVEDKP